MTSDTSAVPSLPAGSLDEVPARRMGFDNERYLAEQAAADRRVSALTDAEAAYITSEAALNVWAGRRRATECAV